MKVTDKEFEERLKEVRSKDSFRTSFGVGVKHEALSLVFWKDDGTWGQHITVCFKDVPVGTIPIVDNHGFMDLIIALCRIYKAQTSEKGIKSLADFIKKL